MSERQGRKSASGWVESALPDKEQNKKIVMEKIIIESTGFDIEQHIDAVAAYVRENGYPRFSYQPIDFHWVEGECLSCGWMISEIKDKHLLNSFTCQYGWSKTNGGIAYDPECWNKSAFEVDGHYYFMDK